MRDIDFKDYYKILGISVDNTKEDIRKAFLKKTLESHPDKLRIDENSEFWKKVNEYIQLLNEAYFVLSNPEKKEEYDFKYYNHYGKNPQEEYANIDNEKDEQKKERVKNEKDNFISKKFHFSDLPKHIQEKILKRQNSDYIFKIKLSTVVNRYVWSIIILFWLPILIWIMNKNKSMETGIVIILVTVILVIGILLLRNYLFIKEWHKTKVKCNFLITPLYFIKTYFDEINYWCLWDLKNIQATEHYTNGIYNGTFASLFFPDAKVYLNFNSRKKYREFVSIIEKQINIAAYARQNNNYKYFIENDDLHTLFYK